MIGDLGGGFGGLDLDKSPGDVGVTTNEKGDVIYDPYAAQSIDKTKRTFTPVTAGMSRWDVPAGLTVSPGIPTSSPTFRQKRQAGERPVFDWIRGRMQANREARQAAREEGKQPVLNWLMHTAGIMNPALRMPIAAYQTARSLKGIRSVSPAQRIHVLAMNFMGGSLSKMFGPRASALGGIMALRQGNLPKRDIFANMLVRNAPRGYRDVAGGIAGLVKSEPDSYRQIASNLGRSRVGKYIGGQIARRMWQEGADPRWIQAVVPTMTKTITERIIPEPPGPE